MINYKKLAQSTFFLTLFCSTTYGMERLAIEGAPNVALPDAKRLQNLIENPYEQVLLEAPSLQVGNNPQVAHPRETVFELTPPVMSKIDHEDKQSRLTFVSDKLEDGEKTGEIVTFEKFLPHEHSPDQWEHDVNSHQSTRLIETFITVDGKKISVKEDRKAFAHEYSPDQWTHDERSGQSTRLIETFVTVDGKKVLVKEDRKRFFHEDLEPQWRHDERRGQSTRVIETFITADGKKITVTEDRKSFPHQCSTKWNHSQSRHVSTPLIENFIEVDGKKIIFKKDDAPRKHTRIRVRSSVPAGQPWKDANFSYQRMQHEEIWERTGIDGERYTVIVDDETLKTPIPKPVVAAPVAAPPAQVYSAPPPHDRRNAAENFFHRSFGW